jgi:hypothetical protein
MDSWTVHRLATSKASLSEISARLTEAQADAKAAANPTEPAPPPPIKKVSWAQVGRVAEPGRYMFRFGWLTIFRGGFSRVGATSERGLHPLQNGNGD